MVRMAGTKEKGIKAKNSVQGFNPRICVLSEMWQELISRTATED